MENPIDLREIFKNAEPGKEREALEAKFGIEIPKEDFIVERFVTKLKFSSVEELAKGVSQAHKDVMEVGGKFDTYLEQCAANRTVTDFDDKLAELINAMQLFRRLVEKLVPYLNIGGMTKLAFLDEKATCDVRDSIEKSKQLYQEITGKDLVIMTC